MTSLRPGTSLWDLIDAHDTGGKAEAIVRALNGGMSESVAARVFGVGLSTVYYLCAHEEYSVNPKILRDMEALRCAKESRVYSDMHKLLSKLRKAVRNARAA